jgi:hypothetical protein
MQTIKVIAIKKVGRKQIKSVFAENVTTPAEATAIIGQMLGQDGIVDGYWDYEVPPVASERFGAMMIQ